MKRTYILSITSSAKISVVRPIAIIYFGSLRSARPAQSRGMQCAIGTGPINRAYTPHHLQSVRPPTPFRNSKFLCFFHTSRVHGDVPKTANQLGCER